MLSELIKTLPQIGRVEWIGVRPARRAQMLIVDQVNAVRGVGLEGDRYSGKTGKRDVTLVQHEYLQVIASLVGLDQCSPELLRRNISVSGLNLNALKGRRFRIGSAVLEYTGLCHPCSQMERVFGPGGYNAIRGHGGITAQVLEDGEISLASDVVAL